MHPRSFVFLLFLGLLLPGCERPIDVHWEDDNFKVYATDETSSATLLGYDHEPGILGLIPPDVVAVGSNKEIVVVKRLGAENSSGPQFYLITKETESGSMPGTVRGPMTQETFDSLKKERAIPEFSWTK